MEEEEEEIVERGWGKIINVDKGVEKLEPSWTDGRIIKQGATTMGNNIKVPQKFIYRTTKWSSNSTSQYISKRIKSRVLK